MSGETFIYLLHDPTDKSQRIYVGMTKRPKKRFGTHLTAARTLSGAPLVGRWLRALLARGVQPEMITLEIVPPGGDWKEAERFWIAYFRSIGAKMANISGGGDGITGWQPSAETRARMSRAQRGKVQSADTIERRVQSLRGQRRTPEQRRNMSVAMKGKPKSHGHIESIRVARAKQLPVLRSDSSTGYLGVFKNTIGSTFMARCKKRYLGCFPTPEAAARAYDEAARALWGADAALNFPGPGERPARRPAVPSASK